jgi:hypothetical protein
VHGFHDLRIGRLLLADAFQQIFVALRLSENGQDKQRNDQTESELAAIEHQIVSEDFRCAKAVEL